MPAHHENLHGNVPEQAAVALLLIDVINDLEFPGSERLVPFALRMAPRLAKLKARARRAGIPAIYVNDNFGRWRSDFHVQVEHCLGDVRGKPLAELLRPEREDYFVLKPKHSGFFSTSLDILLAYLQVETVIIAGLTADNCVLFTANDAYMRDLHLIVPSDCVASQTAQQNRVALAHIRRVLKADVRPSTAWRSAALKRLNAHT